MSYDLRFLQISGAAKLKFPVEAGPSQKLSAGALPWTDAEAAKARLLSVPGAKPGPEGSVDYMGRGLAFARFMVQKNCIHVDNNLNCAELMKVYVHLRETFPDLLILDLQSGQLHDQASYTAWWSRPL